MEDVSIQDMGTGILVGLAALGKPRGGWMLRGLASHRAAAAVYNYLSSLDEFDVRFHIFLDYQGRSPVWAGEIDHMLYSSRLMNEWVPGNDFELLVTDEWLPNFMHPKGSVRKGLPGTERLWLQCAEIFWWVYNYPEKYLL